MTHAPLNGGVGFDAVPRLHGRAVTMLLAVAMWVLCAAPAPAPVLVSVEGVPLVEPTEPRLPVLGAAFDVGAPDGAALSLILFPRRWFQLSAAALTHLGGAGFRLSVAVSPVSGAARPLIALDYGHYFPGDFSWFANPNAPSGVRAALKGVQYDFVNAHLGLELGAGRFSFSIRGGVSYLAGVLGAFEQGPVTSAAPRISAVLPSGKLGLTWVFF
jgi:hypothetical protein